MTTEAELKAQRKAERKAAKKAAKKAAAKAAAEEPEVTDKAAAKAAKKAAKKKRKLAEMESTEAADEEPPTKKQKVSSDDDDKKAVPDFENDEDSSAEASPAKSAVSESSPSANTDGKTSGKLTQWNMSKAFGFIEYTDSSSSPQKIFVHINSIFDIESERDDPAPALNQSVLFTIADENGKVNAIDVTSASGGALKGIVYHNGDAKIAGEVAFWNDDKGFGFIQPDDEQWDKSFCHWSKIMGARGFDSAWLEQGERVTFDLVDDPKNEGGYNAANVAGESGKLKCGAGGGRGGGSPGSKGKGGGSALGPVPEEVVLEKCDDDMKDGKHVGVLVRWNGDRGFGFITPNKAQPDGKDLFAHANDIDVGDGSSDRLMQGQTVLFNIEEDEERGKTSATEVTGLDGKPCLLVKYANEEKLTGSVMRWNDDKGFGFVAPDAGGEDVFVHFRNIKGVKGFDQSWLEEGEKVEYDMAPRQGKWEAANVSGVDGAYLKCQQ